MKMTSVSHRALALLLFATPLTLALSPGSGAPPGGASVVSQRALMEPLQVVEAQLAALKAGDCKTCFDHASPVNRRVTGPVSYTHLTLPTILLV